MYRENNWNTHDNLMIYLKDTYVKPRANVYDILGRYSYVYIADIVDFVNEFYNMKRKYQSWYGLVRSDYYGYCFYEDDELYTFNNLPKGDIKEE